MYGQILHVPFLKIHHHYITYCCCPYIVNTVLLTCQESKTKVFVTFSHRQEKGRIPFPGFSPDPNPNCNHWLQATADDWHTNQCYNTTSHNIRTVSTTLYDINMTYGKEQYMKNNLLCVHLLPNFLPVYILDSGKIGSFQIWLQFVNNVTRDTHPWVNATLE